MVDRNGEDPTPTPDNNASTQAPTPDNNASSKPQTSTADTKSDKENTLTPTELYQLTLYKWRYSLEAYGFESWEVEELMFLKWLHASRRVLP